MKMKKNKDIIIILISALAASGLLGMLLGSVPISIQDLTAIIRFQLSGIEIPPDMKSTGTILFMLRIPRTVMMMLTGAALAISGALEQGLEPIGGAALMTSQDCSWQLSNRLKG